MMYHLKVVLQRTLKSAFDLYMQVELAGMVTSIAMDMA